MAQRFTLKKSICSVPTKTPSLCNFIGSLDVTNCRLNYIYNVYTDIEQHSQWSHQISYAQWTQICTSYSKGLTSKTRDRISATPIFLTLITVCLEIRNYATQNQQSTIKKNTIMRYRSIEPSHLHLSPWTSKGIKKATAIPPCCLARPVHLSFLSVWNQWSAGNSKNLVNEMFHFPHTFF